MHMADALLSPAVGASFWAGTAAVIGIASGRLKAAIDDRLVPLMGVLGAFIFAVQMVNFSIPGTGSSGHLGGGMVLSIILGPSAAFLVMASVLTVQSLFFADGGLLALGCNIWNLGLYPCFIAYPFIYRPLAGDGRSTRRAAAAAIAGAIVGLQLGAFSVVLQTQLSGRAELPFGTFVLLMQAIHLAIGAIEGIVTAGVIAYVRSTRPEILGSSPFPRSAVPKASFRKVLLQFLAASVIAAGVLAWFASTRPDGLEWALEKVTSGPTASRQAGEAAGTLKEVQDRTAFMPDYRLPGPDRVPEAGDGARPRVDVRTSAAGVIGAVIVLIVVVLIGAGVRRARRK